MRLRFAAALALVISPLVFLTPASADNIVLNPGFETGSFADWTVNTASSNPWEVDSDSPFEGTFFASTGCVGAPCISGTADQMATLSQDLATTAATTYTLSFELAANEGPPGELQVLWDGSLVLDLGPGGTLGLIPYTLETVLNLTASSSSTQLEFVGRQDPGVLALDNVDVEAAGSATAPEPASVLLLALAGPVLYYRRRLIGRRARTGSRQIARL